MGVKLIGIDKMTVEFNKRRSLEAVKIIVKHHGAELTKEMQRQTKNAFTKGYSNGDTRRSIKLKMEDDGLTADVSPGTDYAAYVEYGTRYMEAEPFVKPAFNKQKEIFKQDMDRLVK